MQNISVKNKRIAVNSIIMFMRMAVILLLTLYTTRKVLEVLGIEDYGIYNVVCGFVSMFTFLNTALSNGIQRFHNYELGRNGVEGAIKVYNNAILIQLLLVIVVTILTETFGLWYINNRMVLPEPRIYAAKWIFHSSVISFVFIIFQAPYSAAVMAHERMSFYAIVNILDAILKLLIVYVIPISHTDGLIIYGILLSLISILNFILYLVYSKVHFKEIKITFQFDKSLFKSMLGFSGWNLIGTFAIIMKDQGINLVLNGFFGPIINAARGVAVQVNGGLNSFVSNITVPVRPQIVQSYSEGNTSRSIRLTYGICKLSSLCYYFLALPICMEIHTILQFWLGDNIPSHSESFIVLTLITAFTSNSHSAISNLVHAVGDLKKFQIYTSLIKLLSIPFSYFLLLKLSEPEVAFIVVLVLDIVAHFVGCAILSTITHFPLKDYFIKVIIPLMRTVVLAFFPVFLCHNLITNAIARLFVVVACAGISVAILGFYLTFDANEKKVVINLLKAAISKLTRYGNNL